MSSKTKSVSGKSKKHQLLCLTENKCKPNKPCLTVVKKGEPLKKCDDISSNDHKPEKHHLSCKPTNSCDPKKQKFNLIEHSDNPCKPHEHDNNSSSSCDHSDCSESGESSSECECQECHGN